MGTFAVALMWALIIMAPIAILGWLMAEESKGRKPVWAVNVGFVGTGVYLITLVIWNGITQ